MPSASAHHHRLAHIAAIAGMIGIFTILTGAFMSAMVFTGRTHEPYSILNHFISELGNKRWYSYAMFFNIGLMLAGIPLLVFLNASAMLLHSWLRYPMMVFGTISGVTCSLIGVYPESDFYVHITIAPIFFSATLLSLMIYCVGVWIEHHHLLDRRYALAGVPAGVFLVVLLWELIINAQEFIAGEQGAIVQMQYHRPEFWMLPFIEWMVLLSLLALVAFFSIVFYVKAKKIQGVIDNG